MRVVSLLPSATEILCRIGGRDLLVGRSHECDWPAGLEAVPVLTAQRITATTSAAIDAEVRATLADDTAPSLYHLDAETLRSLRPDVILTQDLCAVCSIDLDTVRGVAASLDPAPAIVSLDPKRLEDVFDDVLRIGVAIGRERAAHASVVELRDAYWSAVDFVNAFVDGPVVAFLEWMAPLFTAGHWTPQLITAAGGRHPFGATGTPSSQLDPAALVAAQPDRLIVCPCGMNLDAIDRELPVLTEAPWWNELPAVRSGQIALVDGNQMFNRPGPRLVDAFRWLVGWLNDRPEMIPTGFPWREV